MFCELIAECSDYDFKVSLEERRPKSWLKSVSAFSNGLGGTLFFGIDDNKTVVGIENPQYVCDKISEIIKEKIYPFPNFELKPLEKDGKIVIALKVNSGPSTPYYCTIDGNEAYIRNGNQTIISPAYILEELILKGQNKTYDSIPTSYLKSDYSFTFFEADFYDKTFTKITNEDYISFSLMDKDGHLTNAGVLLADQNIYIDTIEFFVLVGMA